MRSHFSQQIIYYVGYNFFIVVTTLLLVSLVAFFHFLLDHRLGIIEEWIFQNSYQILILSKFLSLLGILSFVNVRTVVKNPIKTLLRKGFVFLHYKVFAISFLQIFVIIFLAAPKWAGNGDVLPVNILTSFVGTVLFYLLDIFLLVTLQDMIPVKGWPGLWLNLIYATIFFGVAKFTFFYGTNVGGFIFFNSFFCFYLAKFGKNNWTLPITWLILVAAPLSSLMGMDILWKDTYALFKFTQKVDKTELSILMLVSLLYLSGMGMKWYNVSKRRKYGKA